MKVKEVMTSRVQSCRPENNLAEVAQMMWEHDCGVIPVVNPDGAVAGVITDRDICIAVATRDQRASEIAASSVTSPKLHVCSVDTDVQDALKTMREARVRRLVVVTPEQSLAGILSMGDVVQHAKKRSGAAVRYSDAVETLKGIYTHH